MKLLYISSAIIPSTTANSIHVMKMCQALANAGNQVCLIAKKSNSGCDNIYEYYNIKNNFEIKYLDSSTFVYLLKLLKILNEIRPDFIYGRFLHGCTLSVLLGYPTMYEVHDLSFGKTFLSKISFYFLRKSANFRKLVAITYSLQKDVLKKYKDLCPKQTLVLPDGADIPRLDLSTNRLHNYEKAKLNIGYMGGMQKGKGVDIVVALANEIPHHYFHVVGGVGHDIEFWKSKCLHSNIFFYGFVGQSELKDYVNYFDICLLPNQKEVFVGTGDIKKDIGKYTSPLKLFEYISYKKPIVASDLDVIREVLNHDNSVLVPPDDIEKWKKAIFYLEDPIERQKIGEHAFRDFVKNYTWDKRAQKICL